MSLNPNSAAIRFVKAEANGNDFLIVDAAAVAPGQRARFSRESCDRHRGLGADGVEFVSAGEDGFELALYNADGGAAEVSGNGTRCVAAFYARRGFRQGTLRTGAGAIAARVIEGGGEASETETHQAWTIELEMAAPQLEANATLAVLGREVEVTVLSMGNPQCVALVKAFPADWEALGAAIESHPRFPQRTNVEFVRVIERHRIEIRIYERGVGPTQSSGTGSCAAAVAAIAAGRADSPIEVASPGGAQRVSWAGAGTAARLTGPARVMAEGVYFFDIDGRGPQPGLRPGAPLRRAST